MLEIIFRDTYISIEIRSFAMENATHKKVADILTKANFSHESPGLWQQTNDLPKWYKQCESLVNKVGGEIIDKRGKSKIGEISYFETQPPTEPIASSAAPEAIAQTTEQRIAFLEAEVKRLGEIGAIASQELQQLEQQLKQLG